MEHLDEHGWGFSDKFTCSRHASSPILRTLIDKQTVGGRLCDYCGSQEATPLDKVLAEIEIIVKRSWTLATNSIIPPQYHEEWGLHWYDAEEMLDSAVGAYLFEEGMWSDICDAFAEAGNQWVTAFPLSVTPENALSKGWQRFSYEVRYVTRHLFFDREHEGSDELPPTIMLQELGKLIHRYGLFRHLPIGHEIWRGRTALKVHPDWQADELGSPPRHVVIGAQNRMSPPGISFFYGADAIETVAAELGGLHPWLVAGRFEASKPLLTVDFVNLPQLPEIFDHERYRERCDIGFLQGFLHEVSQPLHDPKRLHVDYVPTQVVSEYMRHKLRGPNGERLDGLIYRSSRISPGECVVLFIDHEECLSVHFPRLTWVNDSQVWKRFQPATVDLKGPSLTLFE